MRALHATPASEVFVQVRPLSVGWHLGRGRFQRTHLLEMSASGYASSGEVSPRAPPWPEGSTWACPLLQGLAGVLLHWACRILTCQNGLGVNSLTCSEKATPSSSSLMASRTKGPGPGYGGRAKSGHPGHYRVNSRSTCPPDSAVRRAQDLLTPNAVVGSGHQRAGKDQGPPSSEHITPGLTSGPWMGVWSQTYSGFRMLSGSRM